ncbi:MAG: BREX system ATP-binding domain-containing protein, partial [Lachnospiraceae bacterium]|nr:BREX system ATP-binding domain-containing protein [Lachnospiraceae bacterium]
GRIGADQNNTPREVIRDFIELLDLLYQNPSMKIGELLRSDEFSFTKSEAVSDETEAGFAEFTI